MGEHRINAQAISSETYSIHIFVKQIQLKRCAVTYNIIRISVTVCINVK